MRKFIPLALGAVLASTTAMAQDQSADQNRAAQAAPAQPATTQVAKQAEPKICKRLAHGKVCMTAKKWKEADEIM